MSTKSTIWMGDIEPKMTEKEIMNYFLQFNIRPQNVKLIKDKRNNENKNYCFINFKTINEANKALFKLNGKRIPGSENSFRLNWAHCRSSFNKCAYIGNLNSKVDDIKLFGLFKKKYPSVQHASVITENGISKGYGFVLFNEQEEYERSLKEMNGILFYGNILKVREQKKKINRNNESIIDNDENDEDNSSSINDSEQNNEELYININRDNIQNNQIMNNNIVNINSIIDKIQNNNINKLNINNIKNISSTTLNNIENINGCNIKNNTNKIAFNYNKNNQKIRHSNLNNESGNIPTKSSISNNLNISLKSMKSEKISNNSTAKKYSNEVENLKYIDELTLFYKIHEGLNKIYKYYQENPFFGNKKINRKYINILIFIIVSQMFLYYLSAVPLDN